jgi:Fe-S cluster assembly ATP-binding protein
MHHMHKNHELNLAHVSVLLNRKRIVDDVNLTIKSRELHVMMGPNASGKSTLAMAIAGKSGYEVTPAANVPHTGKSGIWLDGKNLHLLAPDARVKAGIFTTMQSPVAVSGVSIMEILRSAYQAVYGSSKIKTATLANPGLVRPLKVAHLPYLDFISLVSGFSRKLGLADSLLSGDLGEKFSGGERKKMEMLTALVLKPKFAVFDEIDTGLDVDSLRMMAGAISGLIKTGTGVLLITHFRRILEYLAPDRVHILVGGRIVDQGDAGLAKEIEAKGYGRYA